MDSTKLMLRFEKKDLQLVELNGERFMSSRALAHVLNIKIRSIKKLISEMRSRSEMKEGVHFVCIPFPSAGGSQITILLTYRGVIRISMRSDSPRALIFRDWAEEVLYATMIGVNEDPLPLRHLVEKYLKEIGTVNFELTRKTCDLILSLRTGESSTVPIKKYRGLINSGYITAIAWIKKYYFNYFFHGMNRGGKFERFIALRYFRLYDRWPQHEDNKRLYAFIYSDVNDREFLENSLTEFLNFECSRPLCGLKGSSKSITSNEVQKCLN